MSATQEIPEAVECDCLTKVDARIAPDHSLDVTFMWNGNGGLSVRPYSRLLRKDNGKPETRSGRPSIFAFSHCPFCGVPYPKGGQ
jgi:hypothetical protein